MNLKDRLPWLKVEDKNDEGVAEREVVSPDSGVLSEDPDNMATSPQSPAGGIPVHLQNGDDQSPDFPELPTKDYPKELPPKDYPQKSERHRKQDVQKDLLTDSDYYALMTNATAN